MSEGEGQVGRYGQRLLEYTGVMLEYWQRYKEGRLTRASFQYRMRPLRRQFEGLLEEGAEAGIKGLSGSCKDILFHRAALWTFVDEEGVEPTNNHAEQQLRAFVLWRRRSFGSQSARGNEFAESMMTLWATARKQGRNVWRVLTSYYEAHVSGTAPPSLFVPQLR